MKQVKDIIGNAISLGACIKSGKATDWKSLCWLFFSPQGREFCSENNYPPIEMFREMADNVEPYGVYVEKYIKECNKDIALIGKCEQVPQLLFSGVEKPYKVILMHGAKAVISLEKYAVVRIENIGGSYDVINDGTGVIL